MRRGQSLQERAATDGTRDGNDAPPLSGNVPAARSELLEAACRSWTEKLIDTTRRNNLLYFRDLKTGTLDLTRARTEDAQQLLGGQRVPVTRLAGSDDGVHIAANAREIGRRATANLEEKGLATLFVAIGLATWEAQDDGRAPAAPVILVPVEIVVRGRIGGDLEVRRAGDIQINPVLLYVLSVNFGVQVEPDEVLGHDVDTENEEGPDALPDAVFARLRERATRVKGFHIAPRIILGNFSFQKMAMVQDLTTYSEGMADHALIAAMAGDMTARATLAQGHAEVDPHTLDGLPLTDEFLILDADSSQQRVIETVRRGQSCVVQGPPGTGKSQTIANLIAALAAQGQRVLFVAEKRAALEVVMRRLDARGLGHLGLDLHGADISRKQVLLRVARALETVHNALPAGTDALDAQLLDRRNRLNAYVTALHTPRAPAGATVYDMQARLLQLPAAVHSNLRWRGPILERLDAPTARHIIEGLQDLSGLAGFVTGEDPSPWTGAPLADSEQAQKAIDGVGHLETAWRHICTTVESLCTAVGMRMPSMLEELVGTAQLFVTVNRLGNHYAPTLWHLDLRDVATDLAPASRSPLAAVWALVTADRYRRALAAMRASRNDPNASVRELHRDALAARDCLQDWAARTGRADHPQPVPGAEDLLIALRAFREELAALQVMLPAGALADTSVPAITSRLSALVADGTAPYRIARIHEIERELDDLGIEGALHLIRTEKPAPPEWPRVFEYAWLSSCLEAARAEAPILATFSAITHDEIAKEFRDLDRTRLQATVDRVRRRHAEHVIATMNAEPEQAFLVRHEAQKHARHKPIRKLLAEAPGVLLALFPCWMASPLSVSQLIAGDQQYFDVVLFDEASQVLPEDAVPAILRGARVVVAGDRQQLPPTLFFVDGANEDDSGTDDGLMTEGFESLLDQMSAFLPTQMLEWHYRSLDESLIAFSNHHIYEDRLVTFPGPGGGEPAVAHELVPQKAGRDGEEESAAPEVQRVVELVLAHATARPAESLGVIAMGIKHARQVQAALDDALRDRPELDTFFDPTLEERFFVKNLERVQGDERDAIILTVGYGKDRGGNLPHRFGPLTHAGGERRLNVAVTRARRRMTVVSSFEHYDVDPRRSSARGVELLKFYLEFAATKGAHLGQSLGAGVPMNPFEEDIYHALTHEGIGLVPQFGASRYRLDFAVQHPDQPGRYILALECDGATYHSAPTARDRDRLRQQQLEALGWHFHRIWSTDWFADRAAQIARVRDAYEGALQAIPPDAPASAPPLAAEPKMPPVAQRGPRPRIPHRESIDQYWPHELQALVRWIKSDGHLRTDAEILDEMVQELHFKRKGPRIVAAIQRAMEAER